MNRVIEVNRTVIGALVVCSIFAGMAGAQTAPQPSVVPQPPEVPVTQPQPAPVPPAAPAQPMMPTSATASPGPSAVNPPAAGVPPQPAPLPLPAPLGFATQPVAPAQQPVSSAGTQPTPNPLHLTIDEAIRMALSEGTQARLARTGEARAQIARSEALANLLPQADARLMRSNESVNLATFGFTLPGFPPVIGPFNVTDAQLTAAMQLFNVAALRAYEARKAGVTASRFDVERTENDVANAVARLYVLVARADAQVSSRAADVTLFSELARVSNDEFTAGTGTRLDVAQANVQLARARQSLLAAQNDRETARLALLDAIGADESVDIVLGDASPSAQAPPSPDAAIATARDRRPELKAIAADEDALRLTYEAQRDRRLPSVGLNFQGDIAGNHVQDLHSSRTIAAVASMPVFRGDINASIARARLDLEDVRTRHAAARRDIEQEVRSSLLALENATARVTVASENVKVAEDALTIARDRRSAGYGSPVEVDRAEDTYRLAHEDLIAARSDAAMAWYNLQHATGDIRALFAGTGQK